MTNPKFLSALIWDIFIIISVAIFSFLVLQPPVNYGGDLAEYYGITESLINHKGISLEKIDKNTLSSVINPVNFTDPKYYLQGRNGNRYPVHFIFYSLLLLPVRLILQLFQMPELNVFRMTNLIIFSTTSFLIMKFFLESDFKKFVFLLTFYLSPLIWFIIWPGPDIFYLSLLLLAVFVFFQKKYFIASLLVAVSSWQSQPLFVLAILTTFYYLFKTTSFSLKRPGLNKDVPVIYSVINPLVLLKVFLILIILAVPYFYNLVFFNTLTPWTIFNEGWTINSGFGLQNSSLQRLFEQFFDLNFGLFFYIPLLLLLTIFFLIKNIFTGIKYLLFERSLAEGRRVEKSFDLLESERPRSRRPELKTEGFSTSSNNKKLLFIFTSLILTAFFYQTNPAWSYGTSGFGPSRHILFIIPFLIFTAIYFLKPIKRHILFLVLFAISQSAIIYLNGGLFTNFMNSLSHSPIAKYVLETYPEIYNPTPEIFVDRTNHTDLNYPTTAIYKSNGFCKKAYVLYHDKKKLEKECGFIPKDYLAKFQDPYNKKEDYERITTTLGGIFWADPTSCYQKNYPNSKKPYICMQNLSDTTKYTGIKDLERIEKLEPYKGAWRLKWGPPIRVTIPPGYFINAYSWKGIYVNY